MPNSTDHDWEYLGQHCPYWGVITQDAYLPDRMSEAARLAFFATGEQHIHQLFQIIDQQLVAGFQPQRALDFGCGVGRLTLPLARHAQQVVGVDVSPSMLAEAERNAQALQLSNLQWVQGDDTLSRLDGQFDLIHSYIVFQHIPTARGEQLIKQLLGRLAPGGVGALHLTYYDHVPRRQRLRRWAEQRLPLARPLLQWIWPLPVHSSRVQMHCYDLNRVFWWLEQAGCGEVVGRLSLHGPHAGAMLVFVKQPGRLRVF